MNVGLKVGKLFNCFFVGWDTDWTGILGYALIATTFVEMSFRESEKISG